MLTLNPAARRLKRQAVYLSPIQLAWHRTWKSRVHAGLRYLGLCLGALGLFIAGWAFIILMFSF